MLHSSNEAIIDQSASKIVPVRPRRATLSSMPLSPQLLPPIDCGEYDARLEAINLMLRIKSTLNKSTTDAAAVATGTTLANPVFAGCPADDETENR